ncbi:hypothetical protein GCM10023149_20160 [Mucilaginibacter gynuensis]|uniref:HMA domain-containing protein n=1 Tax=Mucilaginibacter gynuensis TaxID=1302236 RepID=A0ABP8GBD2_9SPHI
MTHTYNITGMTCTGCQAKVQGLLSKIPGVTNVAIDLPQGTADITMAQHIATPTLKDALKDYPKYQLSEAQTHQHTPIFMEEETDNRTWLATYKPILIIFGYVTVITLFTSFSGGTFHWMKAMTVFMSGFFLTFSMFKMLDLQGFADSYSSYDIVAKKFRGWGLIYAFIELFLGLAYAINFEPFITNVITFVVMTVSIIGVLQSVLNKQKIKCACLGTGFNLPMSTVTIIEDGMMILMSAVMLVAML